MAHGGPGPEDYFAYKLNGSEIAERRTGHRPEHADIVFSYRPLEELPDILATALEIGARILWFQNDGSADHKAIARAEKSVRDAGLIWISAKIIDALA